MIQEKLKINKPSKIKPPKPLIFRKMWAYYAPDGNIQLRSIADTKVLSREMISQREWSVDKKVTYKDYESAGYYIKKIIVDIDIPIELKIIY